MAPNDGDFIRIPQKSHLQKDFLTGSKKLLRVPDMQILPQNAVRESYLKLLANESKAFNRSKHSSSEFVYQRSTYEKVRDSWKRIDALRGQGSSAVTPLMRPSQNHSPLPKRLHEIESKVRKSLQKLEDRGLKDRHVHRTPQRGSKSKLGAFLEDTSTNFISNCGMRNREQTRTQINIGGRDLEDFQLSMPLLAQQSFPLAEQMADEVRGKRNPFGDEPKERKSTHYTNFFGPSLSEVYKDMSTTEQINFLKETAKLWHAQEAETLPQILGSEKQKAMLTGFEMDSTKDRSKDLYNSASKTFVDYRRGNIQQNSVSKYMADNKTAADHHLRSMKRNLDREISDSSKQVSNQNALQITIRNKSELGLKMSEEALHHRAGKTQSMVKFSH